MFICIECYNRRGEKALLHDGEVLECQFCGRSVMCYDLKVWELRHWRDVVEFQKNNEQG